MAKVAITFVLISVAIALLGILVLVSTSANDDAQRRLDLSLRLVRDMSDAIERTALVAVDNGTVQGQRLADLDAQRVDRLELAAADLEQAYPLSPGGIEQIRRAARRAFNSIDVNAHDQGTSVSLNAAFNEIDAVSADLSAALDAFQDTHQRHVETLGIVSNESRDFVRELRQRQLNASADVIFRASQQVLSRIEQGSETSLDQVAAIVSHMVTEARLAGSADSDRLSALADAARALAPQRRAMDAALTALTENPLPERLASFRERLTADTLYHLSTVGDSRILLNVYTTLLLLVLIYFGARLSLSYRELNLSHDDLEDRVTERTQDLEQAYTELKESQVQLVQAEKMSSLGQLVAGVMHEINTPLMYVLSNVTTNVENVDDIARQMHHAVGFTRALKRKELTAEQLRDELTALKRNVDVEALEETVAEIRQLGEDSVEGLNQISELVQSLKDFSRLDRAGEDRFDVREGLEKTLVITKNLIKYGIEVEKDFGEVPPIFCSPSKINQVFINLITNSVQAMDGKGTLSLSTRGENDWVEVTVRDTGCGISEDHLARIMDPFFTTKPVGQGTGLGLSIVKKIVDDHGGQLLIDSTEGVGTQIVIGLPVRRSQQPAEAA